MQIRILELKFSLGLKPSGTWTNWSTIILRNEMPEVLKCTSVFDMTIKCIIKGVDLISVILGDLYLSLGRIFYVVRPSWHAEGQEYF